MAKAHEVIEYVYNPENAPEDFQPVRILLEMGADKLLIIVESDIEMTKIDIENLLKYLERAVLKRKHITLLNDCDVLVKMDGQKYDVVFEATFSVKNLNLL